MSRTIKLAGLLLLAACTQGPPSTDDPPCPDGDSDSFCDVEDRCDGFDDAQDADRDGTPDGCDPCPTDPKDDSDGDGACDADDRCPGHDDRRDTDQDGQADGCDPCPRDRRDDSDRDGVCDSDDRCPGEDDRRDRDADKSPDACDNCPRHRNPDQRDSDGDGYGEVCDRPDEDNDVLIVAVSGHDFSPSAYYNKEYLLQNDTRATLYPVYQFFRDRGDTVQVAPFADALYDESDTDWGFLTMLDFLVWVSDNWVADYDNPTRIVVIAHSHGTVWAHNALLVLPDLPVDVLIDLDGESSLWEDEIPVTGLGDVWYWEIQDYERSYGRFPFDIKDAADAHDIPGLRYLQDVEDVAPDNATWNLEVKAEGWQYVVNDDERNHRFDGSRDGIRFFHSARGHVGILDFDSDAMTWVVDELDQIYP